MREIKFRAWNGYKLKYDITGFEHGEKNEMAGIFIDGDYYKITSKIANKKDAIVMQFTGLYDKNGKEIYEGDICKHPVCGSIYEHFDIVEYSINGFFVSFWPVSSVCEIIGNIHENPEIINQTGENNV